MNKIIGILLFYNDIILNKYIDVNWANFLFRNAIRQGIIDSCKDIIDNINNINKTICINFDSILDEVPRMKGSECYCYKNDDGYTIIVLTKDYPPIYCQKVVQEIISKVIKEDNIDLEKLAKYYNDVKNVDKLIKIRDELDKTKEVLQMSIDKVMERGGNINELIDKTDKLAVESDIFKIRAKKLNSCCSIL